ncbi:MAG: hypothetical protein R3A50_11795 [Saprospiraceae bacterium]
MPNISVGSADKNEAESRALNLAGLQDLPGLRPYKRYPFSGKYRFINTLKPSKSRSGSSSGSVLNKR